MTQSQVISTKIRLHFTASKNVVSLSHLLHILTTLLVNVSIALLVNVSKAANSVDPYLTAPTGAV